MLFCPTFHVKSQKLILSCFNGFPTDSRRLSIYCDRYSVKANHFQSISVSFNKFQSMSFGQYLDAGID